METVDFSKKDIHIHVDPGIVDIFSCFIHSRPIQNGVALAPDGRMHRPSPKPPKSPVQTPAIHKKKQSKKIVSRNKRRKKERKNLGMSGKAQRISGKVKRRKAKSRKKKKDFKMRKKENSHPEAVQQHELPSPTLLRSGMEEYEFITNLAIAEGKTFVPEYTFSLHSSEYRNDSGQDFAKRLAAKHACKNYKNAVKSVSHTFKLVHF